MATHYRIQFDWPSGVIYTLDEDDAGFVLIEELPISTELKLQLRGLSDMFDEGMSKVIDGGDLPSAEQRIVFKNLYDRIIPKVKGALPSDWVLESEEFPGIYRD